MKNTVAAFKNQINGLNNRLVMNKERKSVNREIDQKKTSRLKFDKKIDNTKFKTEIWVR